MVLQLRRGMRAAVSGSRKPIVYLLRDLFTTDASAPLTSPRTAEPGPGTLTLTQTDGQFSISGGKLSFPVQTTSAFGDQGFIAAGLSRVAGRAYLNRLSWSSIDLHYPMAFANANSIDFTSGNNVAHGMYTTTTTIRLRLSAGISTFNVFTISTTGTYDLALVARGTGAFFLARQGTTGPWTLIWVDNQGTDSTLYPVFSNFAAAGTIQNVRVTDLSGAWASDYGIATRRKATSAANDTITMAANAIVEHTITAATGVTQELNLRYTDADNRWIVRMSQSGSTIKLIERNAGTETERSSASQTWTNGTAYRVVAICDGTTITTFVAATQKNSYSSATLNQTATTATVNTAGTNLVSWPRTVTLPNV